MVNFTELAVIWAIALVAVLVSINARGSVRVTFSWVITTLIIGISVVVSTMKVSTFKQQLLDGAASDAPLVAPAPVAAPAEKPAVAEQAPVAEAPVVQESGDQIKDYVESSQRIVGSALGLAGAIGAFDVTLLADLPDTKYEQEQSRALSLRNQASSISRQVKSLRVPNRFTYIQADLDKATESLRLAGWAVHAYFGAENDDDEKNYQDQFLRYSRAAQVDLKAIQQELLRQR